MKQLKLFTLKTLLRFSLWYRKLDTRLINSIDIFLKLLDSTFRYGSLVTLMLFIYYWYFRETSIQDMRPAVTFFLAFSFLPLMVYVFLGSYFKGRMNGFDDSIVITKKLNEITKAEVKRMNKESEEYIFKQMEDEREEVAAEISRQIVTQIHQTMPDTKVKIRPINKKLYEA